MVIVVDRCAALVTFTLFIIVAISLALISIFVDCRRVHHLNILNCIVVVGLDLDALQSLSVTRVASDWQM